MPAIEHISAIFPFAGEATYLNTAAVGLAPRMNDSTRAKDFESATQRGIAGRTIWTELVAAAKAKLATLLGVRIDQVHFTGSTTEGLNLVALGLPLKSGARVAVAADEFPSVIHPWRTIQERGVRVEQVEVPRESMRTDALLSAVAAGAQAVAVSHVHWRTGTRVDLESLSVACRRHGTWLIVDGVQAVGAIPVDASLVDAYCASSFKWLLSGFGLGFMALSDRLISEWIPPLRGYGNEWPSKDPEYAHLNYPGIRALDSSLDYLGNVGWKVIHQRVAELTELLIDRLRAHELIVATPEATRAGIVSVRHSSTTALVRSLIQQQIFVEDRDGLIRASPYLYNNDHDIDHFVTVLADLSKHHEK